MREGFQCLEENAESYFQKGWRFFAWFEADNQLHFSYSVNSPKEGNFTGTFRTAGRWYLHPRKEGDLISIIAEHINSEEEADTPVWVKDLLRILQPSGLLHLYLLTKHDGKVEQSAP